MQAPGPPLQAQQRALRQETDRASAHIRAPGFPHGPLQAHKRGGPGARGSPNQGAGGGASSCALASTGLRPHRIHRACFHVCTALPCLTQPVLDRVRRFFILFRITRHSRTNR